MLLVAFALSSVMFVACNKYDDDIERIDNEIASLQATVQSLKAAVDGGAVISSVSNTTEGVKFTLSNGQSYVVNHGTDGAAGAAGKDGSVVTIGENGNWFIDGVDTGKTAKGQGEPGKSPRINEAGNWEVWDAATEAWVDTEVSAAGASTYVVENGAFYTLNVMEKDAEGNNIGWVAVELPRTALITDIKLMWVDDLTEDDKVYYNNPAGIVSCEFFYGKTLDDETVIKFNGQKYTDETLVSRSATLAAAIQPFNADATLYNFTLVDTKGNSPFVVKSKTNYKSENPLTRAKTENNGIYLFKLGYASRSFDSEDVSDRANRVYALMAQNGVSSEYQIKIFETHKTSNLVFDYDEEINDDGERVIDLEDCINDANHAVDYYFEIADKTKAAAIGAELNGSILTATKDTGDDPLEITVHYLLIDGEKYEGTIKASFDYIAPSGTLDAISWTVTNKTDKASRYTVYRALGDLQASLVGASDTDLPKQLSIVGWSWTDGKGLDTKTVKRNGVKYGNGGTAFTGNESSWITNIDPEFYYINDSGNYTKVTRGTTKIQKPLYVKFTFDYTKAFPGEYVVTLGFKKGTNNTSNNDYEVPVNVTIVDPLKPILKLDNYFANNSAVVYGKADYVGGNATYDLLDLFETKDNMKFEEDEVLGSNDVARASWLSGSVISPKVYSYTANANGQLDRIYTTRNYTVYHTPWGNEHIEATVYEFDVTVKSPIYEGTLTSNASKTIDENETEYFTVSEFTGKDVYGNSYVLGNVYAYDATNKVYNYSSTTAKLDTDRIVAVSVDGDDNADKYLTYGTSFTKVDGFGADVLSVQRKPDQQLQSDVTCTLTVLVLDQWGMIKTQDVTVVLKKF